MPKDADMATGFNTVADQVIQTQYYIYRELSNITRIYLNVKLNLKKRNPQMRGTKYGKTEQET